MPSGLTRSRRSVRDAGGEAVANECDVTDERAVEAMVDAALSSFGRLDVMYANAGIASTGFGELAFEDTSVEEWNRVMGVNLLGFFLSREAFSEADAGEWWRDDRGDLVRGSVGFVSGLGGVCLEQSGCGRPRARPGHGSGSLRHPGERTLPAARNVGDLRARDG